LYGDLIKKGLRVLLKIEGDFSSDRHDSRYDPPEKILRPYVQGTPVHNEGGDFPARLFHIEVIHGLPQEVLESVGSQRFVIAVIAGLTHPGFEVSDPNFRIPARIPYQVVPVAPLHARLPLPAKDRMEFPGRATSCRISLRALT